MFFYFIYLSIIAEQMHATHKTISLNMHVKTQLKSFEGPVHEIQDTRINLCNVCNPSIIYTH